MLYQLREVRHKCPTTVLGEDIDLFVLLLYLADVNSKPLQLKISKKS